jgi:large subunit ribosomal protein L2
MALKKYNPVTSGTRQLVLVDKSSLWKGDAVKSLVHGKTKSGGRNNTGRTTAWRKSGGHKQKYRIVDFNRNAKDNINATVERLEYDPNRTAFIALLKYDDGDLAYILAPQKLSAGDNVISGTNVDIKIGNALPLKNIPVGTIVHNVEMKAGKGGQLARAAGSYVQLVGKDGDNAQLKLRSGELRIVNANCRATIGAVSNPDNQNISIGKAGRNRWLGVKPSVRGIAMNPVDHPHGGRTNGGRHPVSPWGQPTKGKLTRKNKRTSKYIVRRRGN